MMDPFFKEVNHEQTDKPVWNELYKAQVTPWNLGKEAAPLRYLLETMPDPSPAVVQIRQCPLTRCLVPGCGQGYDVAYLASRTGTKEAYGLDISELAVEEMKRLHESRSNCHFLQRDFFKWTDQEGFDLVFDYTPQLRPAWGSKMQELVKKDKYLVTLMFPLDKVEGGPPFHVNLEAYREVLTPGFRLIVEPFEGPMTSEQRKGREKLAVWQRV